MLILTLTCAASPAQANTAADQSITDSVVVEQVVTVSGIQGDVTSVNVTAPLAETIIITAEVRDGDDNPVPNTVVTFVPDYKCVTDANGTCQVTVTG